MSSVLVLGGTSFVGRAIVADAVARGLHVTTLNRGATGTDHPDVRVLRADRNDPVAVAQALRGRDFDAVIDVSGLAPVQVAATTRALRDRVGHYSLVSTVTTYSDEAFDLRSDALIHEDAPTLPADPDDPSEPDMARYGEQKRACELVLLREFGPEAALIARPGLILGPHENVHRIPYWLGRAASGGQVIGPGHPGRRFQFVDVRDLAQWLVTSSLAGLTGTYHAINPPDRDTWGDWWNACAEVTGGKAQARWIDDETLLDHGVEVAFGVPMWFAEDLPGFVDDRLRRTGFVARPLLDTVQASWEWLRPLAAAPPAGYRPAPMSRDEELRILAATAGVKLPRRVP